MGEENNEEQGTGDQASSGLGDSDNKTFSQEQVTSMMAREKQQGRDAGKSALLKELGYESLDEAKSALQAHREAQDRNKSEAELEKAAAATEKAVAAEEKILARRERYEARVERALVGAGCTTAKAIRLVDIDYDGKSDVPDMDDIKDAVKALKKEMPQLFSSDEGSSGNQDSDTGKGGGKKKERTPQEVAQDRLAKYKERNAAPMETYDDLVQRT